MKQLVMNLLLTILGTSPFVLGRHIQNLMNEEPNIFPTSAIIFTGLGLFVFWFLISMAFKVINLSRLHIFIFLNLAGGISVFFILIQTRSGAWWSNSIGVATQNFYLSLIGLISMIFRWIPYLSFSVLSFISFSLLLLCSLLGMRMGEALTKNRG